MDAKNKTAEAKSSKPPVITKIEFPKVIPITGERIRGLMYFKDPDGDAYKYKVDVVKATDFEGGMYFIKMNRLYSGDYHDGVYIIKSFCYSPQDVTLRVTLYDARGKKSNPMDYSFTCK